MSNSFVSIIIVTKGIKDYLNLCLESIKNQTYSPLEIIVINNSLNQNFNLQINKSYPTVKLYSSSRNLFYCQALNMGIEISKGDFILCLNDDVILDERFVQEALKGFDIGEKIGMVSGKILRFDKKTIDSTGLFLTPWRTAKERGYGYKDEGQFDKEEYIFGINGAAAFYRREMLEEIKQGNEYFDSDFHIFYEDLDTAWKAQNFGWKGYYIPQAAAYHLRGGTVRKEGGIGKSYYARRYLDDRLHADLIKNRYLTIIKNESLTGFMSHFFYIILYDFIIWTYILFFKPQLVKVFLSNLDCLACAFKKRKLTVWMG